MEFLSVFFCKILRRIYMNKSIMMGRLVRDPEINYTTKKDREEFIFVSGNDTGESAI